MTDALVFDSQHDDMIHDVQMDYYGRRLATCSSDRTVRIFDTDADGKHHRATHTLRGHDGPVWQVAWAHPRFGPILASCGYDGRVIVWRESPAEGTAASATAAAGAAGGAAAGVATEWTRIYEHTGHTASVNAVAWAPQELGAMLACVGSDGKCTVLHFRDDNTWAEHAFVAHANGANAVSWDSAVQPGSLITAATPAAAAATPAPAVSQFQRRIATGGCDNTVKLWTFSEAEQAWRLEETLQGHTDWVRDVAFAPNIGMPRTRLATCGQDRRVKIWRQDAPGAAWTAVDLRADGFGDVVWRVSWSVSGAALAVTSGDQKIGVWRETLKGDWECVGDMDDKTVYASGM